MLCGTVIRLQILSQNRQLMQRQKLVLGPKFGAHIVQLSTNDQGLKTIFVSSRSSCSRQKTSCVVLVDKVLNNLISAVLFVNFFLFSGSFIATNTSTCTTELVVQCG